MLVEFLLDLLKFEFDKPSKMDTNETVRNAYLNLLDIADANSSDVHSAQCAHQLASKKKV
jgi:hypothetical protein